MLVSAGIALSSSISKGVRSDGWFSVHAKAVRNIGGGEKQGKCVRIEMRENKKLGMSKMVDG